MFKRLEASTCRQLVERAAVNHTNDTSEVSFSNESEGVTFVAGDLREKNASSFLSQVRSLVLGSDGSVILDLRELDIEDGVALAACINSLRELRARVHKLVLRCAPQMLGHNLYRTGMLDGPNAIELVDMRLDEPSVFETGIRRFRIQEVTPDHYLCS